MHGLPVADSGRWAGPDCQEEAFELLLGTGLKQQKACVYT